MKDLKVFIIPFKGLSLGVHEYQWDITKKFFELLENQDIKDCNLQVNLSLEKQERMLNLMFEISGELEVECDRCLGKLVLPVQINEPYFIKFGEERIEESEEVLVIPESDYQIDISELIFDYISLSLPIKKVHGEDKKGNSLCDPEILNKLNRYSEKSEIDPRWEALKKLKLDNNN
ncbi:MAG: DUF177 domain-containing protein [Ignavibacteriales bacterium]|nr:DUF177 domain-containing protein [Ignavibacteriales bacterium]MCF8369953.1 DUF177 domain-containing protein [Bacteroidales bacterium]MCF8406094.1 DUF177 domain-containing protein [Bacteroidales bacterium]